MSDQPAIQVNDLKVHFPGAKKDKPVRALDGVNISVNAGSFHAIVGESGCGKATLARTIVGLQTATAGEVLIDGRALSTWMDDRKTLARKMQFVFQNPLGALSRRQSVYQSLEEPLLIHGGKSADERRAHIDKLLSYVELPQSSLDRLPRSLSGGQRQRVAIARALALDPEILVCDEPLSALDVSIQAQVIKLFIQLQQDLGLTIIMISHDLAVVREMCTSVTVMYLGKVVEAGQSAEIFKTPAHPYTQALLSAVPSPNPLVEANRQRIILKGDPPSPMDPPAGCHFHTRCPIVEDICRQAVPVLEPKAGTSQAACHMASIDH